MALGHGLITFNGLFGIGLGKRTARQFLKALCRTEQGCGAVGPAWVGIVNGAKFGRQIFPGFALPRAFFILPQRVYAGLGKIVAFARGRQRGVARVVKTHHHQTKGSKKGQRRGKPAQVIAAYFFGSLGLVRLSGHCSSFCLLVTIF